MDDSIVKEFEFIKEFLNIQKEHVNKLKTLENKYDHKIRSVNFPESLSELIIKIFINKIENRNCLKAKIGDLICNEEKIEVKCFTSNGPISFGPKENWNQIYFLDAINIFNINNNIKIYKCNLTNKDQLWLDIKINKNETFHDKCNRGCRPRLNFDSLQNQLLNHITLVYNDNVFNLLTENKALKNELNTNIMDKENEFKINKKLKMMELCAGTGSFSIVAEKLNFAETIYANDLDKNSKLFFDDNIKSCKLDMKNIFELDIIKLPSPDIITAGFPCQPFSLAGEKKGFQDERSNVFFKIIEIINYHKPRFVILENVKNLLNHDNGKTFSIITNKLNEISYNYKYQILNTSKITEIPQHRERLFIVCFKEIIDYNHFHFPNEHYEKKQIKDFLETEIDPKFYYKNNDKIYEKLNQEISKTMNENAIYQYRRYYVRENKSHECPTLTANMGTGGHNVPIIKDLKGIRKLTPKECFNFQGFPSTIQYSSKISNSGLYKLAGNAITLNVIEKLFQKIILIL